MNFCEWLGGARFFIKWLEFCEKAVELLYLNNVYYQCWTKLLFIFWMGLK